MGIRLKQAGIEDFVVLERADDVGGTWQANTYPGCACDVPSHLYSFSFAPNPDWSQTYSGQREIWGYLRRCADTFGVRPHVRCNCEVRSATWLDGEGRWALETSTGTVRARFVVADRKSTRLNSSHANISYAVFCLTKKIPASI